ncbi:MAG: hypothetical protein A2806_00800 [Candidatus Terrybacteria bacterium RIFCSPHIGHO2_01_FULL_48_17]|uniref:PDZ domain-containing protein n=1 Tax=Candidatus Terrybacteria bacterium RIFCSPHIGHO2_01_FULL_48_17 TaxID=1802362 RepID=A0A1G2PKJ4_9BACT|nr:MAG: hypothetical protein A2806_00800 [Candidatus Terrybacteria bacterium RIFCSPHIGHO2_01_FULL_48_17]OHA53875.1 MAG: hypothetical protein A3A30_01400 [Candidatus Terrybacteria bacterium RIFCSPLOWO2_01_FULL_48_14]
MQNKIIFIFILCGFLITGFVFGAVIARVWGDKIFSLSSWKANPEDSNIDISLLAETIQILKDNYIHPENLSEQNLLWGAIRGLVRESTDDYTTFFDPDEAKRFLEDTSGHFEGIGAEIGFRDGLLAIIAPLEGTPAKEAGLEARDIILAIDDTSTEDITLEEAVAKIRGPAGTIVTLRISRNQEAAKEISITRAQIVVPPLDLKIEDGIATVQFHSFSSEAAVAFQAAAAQITKANARGLILDLRNNPGGFLDQAVKVAGFLLPEDSVVVIERKRGEADIIHRSSGPGLLADFPTVVLMNEGTASAAEILAGALRDERDIKLVGSETFGKGSIQELIRLKQSGAVLKITVGEWRTPAGNSLAEAGLNPDILVEIKPEEREAGLDPQLDVAKSLLP